MRFGSVCAGIEAASAAWHPLGWRASFLSEIEAFPRSVLAHHYPETPLHGDFTTIKAGEYEPIDLLVGGTPCQSFSVAGLRGGLGDDRGNLALQYLRLADRLRPRWLVWENVPGVLSSNGGRDFGAILGGMVELGYGVAYRVLDAQFFGVAQRRRRVFVVGYLGDWRRAAAVLFERHSLSGHPAPRREKGKASTGFAGSGPGNGSGETLIGGVDYEVNGHGANDPTGPLLKGSPTGGGYPLPAIAYSIMPMNSGKDFKGRQTDVAQPVMAAGPAGGNQGGDYVVQPIAEPFLLMERGRNGQSNLEFRADGTANALLTPNGGRGGFGVGAGASAIQERAVCENPNAGPDGAGFRSDDAAYTLEARTVPQAVAFQPGNLRRGAGAPPSEAVFPTLKSDHGRGLSDQHPHIAAASAVRRLTPRECERLQGFPDDFTLVPHRGKPAADGPRYKALGNSMAVPVMRWIGERIQAVEALTSTEAANDTETVERAA
jgi:DNA (cytosine-5)-methyltransferase 1